MSSHASPPGGPDESSRAGASPRHPLDPAGCALGDGRRSCRGLGRFRTGGVRSLQQFRPDCLGAVPAPAHPRKQRDRGPGQRHWARPAFTGSNRIGRAVGAAPVRSFSWSCSSCWSCSRGRLYCNTLCPVGTLLGWLARAAAFRLEIDKNACTKCAACLRVCKAQCIELRSGAIDFSRCVACYDCLGACDDGSIGYRLAWRRRKPAPAAPPTSAGPAPDAAVHDPARRAFIAGTATALAVSLAAGARLCGGPAARGRDEPGSDGDRGAAAGRHTRASSARRAPAASTSFSTVARPASCASARARPTCFSPPGPATASPA